MKKNLFIAWMLLLPLVASADFIKLGEDSNVALCNGIYYVINDNTKTAYVTNAIGHQLWDPVLQKFVDIPESYSGDIVIPSVVGEYRVTAVGFQAFTWNSGKVNSVTLPNTVTTIENDAFLGCSSLTAVNIPSSVNKIGEHAFDGCSGLTSIIIPDEVTSIAECAFRDCIGLTSLTIGSGITSIAHNAFAGCSGLKRLNLNNKTIPNTFKDFTSIEEISMNENVKTIEDHAFEGCTNLISVIIPKSVKSIGFCAFEGCENLNAVHITDLAAWCNIDFNFEGPNMTRSENPLCYAHHLYLNGSEITELVIPKGVKSIPNCAFPNCTSITSVDISNTVNYIGSCAFEGCTSLTSVTIPKSVVEINTYAFNDCEALNAVYISDLSAWCKINFKSQYKQAFTRKLSNPLFYANHLFLNGSEIKDLIIPNDVTTIGDFAFVNCNSLSSLTIPNSVKFIGYGAFRECNGPTSLSIPNSVISIDGEAFKDFKSLKSVNIGNCVTSIGDNAFSGCGNFKTLIIPPSVTYIGNSSFRYGRYRTNVSIGKNVKEIGDFAFDGSSKLVSIYSFNSEPPSCGDDTFQSVDKNKCVVWVPKGYIKAYKDANIWKDFQNIKEIIEGDIDHDGKVDSEDVQTLAADISNVSADVNTADINGDNAVNVADVVALINKLNGQALLGETAFYLIGDHNGWDMTDKNYAFKKQTDGKTWEITIPSEGAGCFKIAPESAYTHQDGSFWSYLLCAESDQHTGLHGIMKLGDFGAWLLNTEGATSYTIRIVPSEMTYQITAK